MWQRAVRYLVGLVGVLVFYLGLKAVLPADGEPLYLVFRYLRYGLVGLWVGLGAPWCFFKLRLMPSAPDEYTDG